MLAVGEDALVCDFAETYHIYDVRSLPATRAAVYASGLRAGSRIQAVLSGEDHTLDQMLRVMIYDRLSQLVWLNSADGRTGANRPEMLFDKLFKTSKNDSGNDIIGYDSPEEFENARGGIIYGD